MHNNKPATILNKFYNFWIKVGNIGTKNNWVSRANSKIKLTNYMAITLAAISFPFSIQFYYLGFHLPGILVLVIVFLYLFGIYFNYKEWHNLSKVWLILLADFAAYTYSIFFGEYSGIRYVLLSYLCIPFLLFELKNYYYIIGCSILCTALFFNLISGMWDDTLPYITTEIQHIIYIPILSVIFFTILLNMFYLSYESSQYEKQLMESKERYAKEIQEARTVIESSQYSGKDNSIAQILESQIFALQKSEEKLLRVNESLLKTNNDLDNFIYTASHDLRAPISNLEGLINAIKTSQYDEINDDIHNITEMMSLSVDRFKNTITELTEISKLQKDSEKGEDVVFKSLFDDVKFSMKDVIVNAEASILSNFEACSHINFAKKNLRSIFYNLLSNAIKYRSLERKLEVKVSTQKIDEEYILLTIRDNGLGIQEEYHDKIFSMFKRAHSHVDGSGVGLYIVKRIMDNCGGRIELESKEGQGSVFRLYFKEIV